MTRSASDLLRLLAMVAVVFIHGTAGGEARYGLNHQIWGEDGLAVLINQLGRFCVPLFVLLSGYGLSVRHHKVGAERPWAFYRDRASRILLPYLVLTPLFLWGHLGRAMNFPALGQAYLNGSGDYHLYFFPIILCCYLFFPLLVRQKAPWVLAWALMAAAILWASPVPILLGKVGIAIPALPSWAPPLWLGYFALGIAWGRGDGLHPRLVTGLAIKVPLVVLAGAFVLGEYHYWSQVYPTQPGLYDHFQRLVVIVYALSFWLFFRALAARNKEKIEARAQPIGRLAALSFPLYLFHTWVLRLMEMSPLQFSSMLLALGTLTLTFLAVWGLDRLLPAGLYRSALGLSEKKG